MMVEMRTARHRATSINLHCDKAVPPRGEKLVSICPSAIKGTALARAPRSARFARSTALKGVRRRPGHRCCRHHKPINDGDQADRRVTAPDQVMCVGKNASRGRAERL